MAQNDTKRVSPNNMKVALDRTKCIGCGSCFGACPDVFEMEKIDGKSGLKGAQLQDNQEIETTIMCAQEAAEVCPVKCIEIK